LEIQKHQINALNGSIKGAQKSVEVKQELLLFDRIDSSTTSTFPERLAVAGNVQDCYNPAVTSWLSRIFGIVGPESLAKPLFS